MGGNVFNGSSPIKREDIRPTLKAFLKEFKRIFPNASAYFEGISTLGSVGKKDISGDLDLALDEKSFKRLEDWGIKKEDVDDLFKFFKKRSKTSSDAMITKRAVLTLIAKQIEESSTDLEIDTKATAGGTLFCQFPQYTEEGKSDKRVQVDVNVGNPDWLKFAYYSDSYQGNVKGLHRTQLMLVMFAIKGYVFSHNYGVKNKESGKVVATTSEQAIKLLDDLYGFDLDQATLSNYFKLQEFLKKNLSEEDLQLLYDTYLHVLDKTHCDIPMDLQNYWLDNQERLDLTGKFLPSDSKLYAFREED